MSIVVAIATLSVLIGLATVYIYTRKMSAAEEQLKTAEAEGAAQPPEVPISGEAEALAAADDAAAAPATTASQSSASAKKNKVNSYYYWHGHEKERAKLGDVAPMPTPHLVSRDDNVNIVVPAISVAKYSWCDGDKFVSVYVETAPPASGEALEESTIDASFTCNAFRIAFTTVDAAGKRRAKQIVTRLSKHIDPERCSTKVRPKTQEILVKLAKKVPSMWIDLEGNASDCGSADDEPLEKYKSDENDE